MSDNKCIVCQKILILDEENVCAQCELKDDNDNGRVPSSVNCGACKVIVEEDSAGLVCDKCNSWYHNSCCENPLIEDLYGLLNEAPNNVKWFCDKCIWETETWIKSFKCGTITNNTKRGRPKRSNKAEKSFKHFLESDSEYDCTKEPMVKIEIQNNDMPFGFDDGQWTDSDDYEERQKVKKKKLLRKKSFQCNQCEKVFSYKSSLNKHMKNHIGQKSYQCDQCEEHFTKKRALKKHLKSHTGNGLEIQNDGTSISSDDSQSSDSENNEDGKTVKRKKKYEMPFQCDKCGRAFSYKISFEKHKENNNCAKTHQCKLCNETFANKADKRKHLKTHKGQLLYQCSHCGKAFARKDHLSKHERIHTGETPYMCDHCGKVFRRQDHLKKHERVHTGEKPYQCTFCDMSFARHDNCKTHERVHTGERPYQCNQCGKGFTNGSNLKQHQKSHTGNDPIQRTSPITTLPIFTKANSTKPFRRTSPTKTLPIFTKANSTLPVSTSSISSQNRTSLSSYKPPSLTPLKAHPINDSYSSTTVRPSHQIPIHQMSTQPQSFPSSPGSPIQNSTESFPHTPPPNLQHSSMSSQNFFTNLSNSMSNSMTQAPIMNAGSMHSSYVSWYAMPSTSTPTQPFHPSNIPSHLLRDPRDVP